MNDTVLITLTGTVDSQPKGNEFNGNNCTNLDLVATPPGTAKKAAVPITFQVAVWGADAQTAFNAQPGASVLVTGKLKMNTWTAKNGSTNEKLAISATSFVILGVAPAGRGMPPQQYGGQQGGQYGGQQQQPPQQYTQQGTPTGGQQRYSDGTPAMDPDDIPF